MNGAAKAERIYQRNPRTILYHARVYLDLSGFYVPGSDVFVRDVVQARIMLMNLLTSIGGSGVAPWHKSQCLRCKELQEMHRKGTI